MATLYSQASGNFNEATATWNTQADGSGSFQAPADGDALVIQAGHIITMNIDTSGWTNGVAGLTISGHATTPGMLRFKYDADGTYALKIKTGTTISGTNAAANGRLLANSDGVWGHTGALAFGRKALISLAGTAKIDALYLDIALYCTQPSVNPYVEIFGTAYVITANAGDDKITFVSPSTTPPQNGTPVTLSGTVPSPLVAGTTYFIRDVSGSTCKLEATIGGGAIDLLDAGSGTIYLHYGKWGPVAQSSAVNTTNGVITWNGVPPQDSTPVCVKSSGTLPTGFDVYTIYYVVAISGNTCKLSLQGNENCVVIPSDVGSGNISMYAGGNETPTAVVNAIQDVSNEAEWVNGDYVGLTDVNTSSDYDMQRLTLTTKAARTLVLSANVNSAQAPCAKVWLVSRNVAIRSATTTQSTPIVDYKTGTHAGVLQCEINATAGTGSTFYGYGVNSSSADPVGSVVTVSGTICGCYYGIYQGAYRDVSANIVCCNIGVYNARSFNISGNIAGCSTGVQGGSGHNLTGTVSGCSNGFNLGSTANITGVLFGCNYGINSGNGHQVLSPGMICNCSYGFYQVQGFSLTGTIRSCTFGVRYGPASVISGVIEGCLSALYGSMGVLNGVDIRATNSQGLILQGGLTLGYGATLSAPVLQYQYAAASAQEYRETKIGLGVYDHGGNRGQVAFYTMGGMCRTAAFAADTHGTPPVASSLIHEMKFEQSARVNWVEFPVWAVAGRVVNAAFYGKLTGTSAWIARPTIGIYDPSKTWQSVAEQLVVSAQMVSNTDWQTLVVAYVPSFTGEVKVRVQGVGGNASGTGTEQLYWFCAMSVGAHGRILGG
jgi:hypothetical protein